MQHKSTHKLHRIECQRLHFSIIFVISVMEGYRLIIHRNQSIVVNRGLVCVPTQILHDEKRRLLCIAQGGSDKF